MIWAGITYALTIFAFILVPPYVHYYGWLNFLWLSNVGLFLTTFALWINSNLLMSAVAVGILVIETVWNIDFFLQLFFKIHLFHITDYMFNASYPLWLRALSLYHVIMPAIWVVYLNQFGYDSRAIYVFIPLYWVILVLGYGYTHPKDNINWVFLSKYSSHLPRSPLLWVFLLAVTFPLCIVLPTHHVYMTLFG